MYKALIYFKYLLAFLTLLMLTAFTKGNNVTLPTIPSSTTYASICSGNSYTFNGTNYSSTGTYTTHLTSALGGDSLGILVLTVNPLPTPTVSPIGSTTFCAGDSVILTANPVGTCKWSTGDKTQSITVRSSGFYNVDITDANGCSAISPYIYITVNPLPTITTGVISDICAGTTSLALPYSSTTGNPDQYSISWNQATLNAGMANVGWTSLNASPIVINNPTDISGTYSGILRIRNSLTGCASIQGDTTVTTICAAGTEGQYITLTAPAGGLISEITFASFGTPTGSCGNFAINPNCHAANSKSVITNDCVGQNGCTFSATIANFGDPCPYTFKHIYVQATTITTDAPNPIYFNVKSPSSSTTNATICSGSTYTFNGTDYSASGTYIAHLTNLVGCDSTATLVLLVNPISTSTTQASICSGSSFTFNGTVYSKAGTYIAHLTSSLGCDSAATLILTVNSSPVVSVINGAEGVCVGNKTNFQDSTIGGVWSSANQLIATVDSNGNVFGISSGSTTISYALTNACGTISTSKNIQVSNSLPNLQMITGVSAANAGSTSTLSDATIGGVWTSDNNSIASVNNVNGMVSALEIGTANIIYTVTSTFGCSASVSVPFTVSCSTVTSSGGGGLESKSMGDAVAKRIYNRALSNTVNTIDYVRMPVVIESEKRFGELGIVTPGSQTVTSLMPSLSAIGTGFTAYDMSADVADLPGMTNASIVKAYDYVLNSQPMASTLISRTYNLVYQHTKPICDRLKEATLLDVKQVTVQNMKFIQYKLLQNTGQIEYAISFSAGIQKGVDSFKIQSVWLTQNFISQDTMFNFQIWSIDPSMTVNMLNSALNKLGNMLPLSQVNRSLGIPTTYISKVTRDQNKLLLTIKNNTASTNAYLNLLVHDNENSINQESIIQPVNLLPDTTTNVTVDLKDDYESDVHLFVDSIQQDLVYMNDGNWNYSISNSAIQPNTFNIINDGIMPLDSTEFRLLRNVNINVNVHDYVSIYKMMKAGGLTKDLTSFTNLEFNATATGAGQLKIVLQKSSISNWNDQYSYSLPVSASMNNYKVSLNDFKSTASNLPLNANDVVTVTFSFISDGSNNINATIGDAKFTQTKSVIATVAVDSFIAKSVTAYPNPAKEKFDCSFQSDKKATLTLKIVELATGRVIESNKVEAVIGNNVIPVVVNSALIKQGTYILVLEGEEARYQPFKMYFAFSILRN